MSDSCHDEVARRVPPVGRREFVATALALSLLRPGGGSAAAPGSLRGTALVIGNAGYPRTAARLKNPVQDARLMERTLRGLGYEVHALFDAGLQEMIDATRTWLGESLAVDVRLLYYAGHGVQRNGRNYLIPVDAGALAEHDVPRKAFNVTDVVDRLSRFETGVNIVVLDACRNWPFPPGPQGRNAPSLKGLAGTNAPRGTLVAYSTSPGMVAADGTDAGNSVYTSKLAEYIGAAGMPVESIFKQVRSAVMLETGNAQVPWETSSLIGEFCFRPDARGRCGT